MYTLSTTKRFEKDLKKCLRRGLPIDEFKKIVDLLVACGKVPDHYKPHKLAGNRLGQWECHIQSDWLLLWEQNDKELTLLLLNTGTHSDLF